MEQPGANRGKVISSPISFYTSDRRTQNIYVEVDQDISDVEVELIYSLGDVEHRVAGVKLDDTLVEFNLDHETLLAGRYRAAIMLSKGDEVLTSEVFTFTVLLAENHATVLEAAATVLIVKRATAGKIILDFFIINFFSFKICAITQKKFNMLFFFRSIESMIG